jgi:hypothetical protein
MANVAKLAVPVSSNVNVNTYSSCVERNINRNEANERENGVKKYQWHINNNIII